VIVGTNRTAPINQGTPGGFTIHRHYPNASQPALPTNREYHGVARLSEAYVDEGRRWGGPSDAYINQAAMGWAKRSVYKSGVSRVE